MNFKLLLIVLCGLTSLSLSAQTGSWTKSSWTSPYSACCTGIVASGSGQTKTTTWAFVIRHKLIATITKTDGDEYYKLREPLKDEILSQWDDLAAAKSAAEDAATPISVVRGPLGCFINATDQVAPKPAAHLYDLQDFSTASADLRLNPCVTWDADGNISEIAAPCEKKP